MKLSNSKNSKGLEKSKTFQSKCPYCGRKLVEDEIYCYFCDQEIKAVKEKEGKKEPEITAYCVKCNKKVNVKNPKRYVMKNKRVSVKGNCPFCSTKVFRILGMEK